MWLKLKDASNSQCSSFTHVFKYPKNVVVRTLKLEINIIWSTKCRFDHHTTEWWRPRPSTWRLRQLIWFGGHKGWQGKSRGSFRTRVPWLLVTVPPHQLCGPTATRGLVTTFKTVACLPKNSSKSWYCHFLEIRPAAHGWTHRVFVFTEKGKVQV